jgi:hypothetical protein
MNRKSGATKKRALPPCRPAVLPAKRKRAFDLRRLRYPDPEDNLKHQLISGGQRRGKPARGFETIGSTRRELRRRVRSVEAWLTGLEIKK